MVEAGHVLFSEFQVIKQLSLRESEGVFLCRNILTSDEKLIVLKIFERAALDHRVHGESLQMEISASYRIAHPNVLRSDEFLQDDNYFGFTMDFIDGCTLAQKLEHDGKLAITFILDALCQIAAGLDAIHQAGILHRDLKPDNVMVGQEGAVKIADFGVAVRSTDKLEHNPDEIIGTLDYLPPEYVQRGQFDRCSDVYALGILAYELITGHPPFADLPPMEALVARVLEDVQPPLELRSDCPLQLNDVIMRALEREPAKRYQSAAEMLASLGPIKDWTALRSHYSGAETKPTVIENP